MRTVALVYLIGTRVEWRARSDETRFKGLFNELLGITKKGFCNLSSHRKVWQTVQNYDTKMLFCNM